MEMSVLLVQLVHDDFGVIAKDAFISTGIDVTGLQTMKGIKTFYCVVMLDPTGEKALTLVPTKAMYPSIEKINVHEIQSADYIHTTGGNPELLTFICKNKSPHTKLSIDIETTMLGKILEKNKYMQSIEYLFINEQTLNALYPNIDYEIGIKDLSAKGPPFIIVTLGSKGSIAYEKSREEFIKQRAFNVPVIDTTGAGDCFNAIFIASMAHGFSLKESMLYASAGAALSIQSYGARSSQPNLSMVLDFIRQRKK